MIPEAGQTLLHYRLIERIGEGGMGVVWKALDTTLDREVAIKILPDLFAADTERLVRFEREAKLLASLNHPNIATVYSVHAQDGVRFLVMELVAGEDLTTAIERGPLPVERALELARQIALALETAHESGVIHRDLKPANVRLTREGQVKVLDFGLAKALESSPASGAHPPSLSPTVTSAGTVAGMILGTASYMSPEQARGQSVDRRADIWSWGAVLFELLAGKRAFAGDTVSDSLASILAREPGWEALPAALDRRIVRLLGRCLDKDVRTRLQDIGEARIALATLETEKPASIPETGPAPVRRWVERAVWLALVLVAAALLVRQGGIASGLRSAVPSPSFTMKRLTELPGPEEHPNLSPDGRMLVYTSAAGGNADVYLVRVGGDRAINLTAGSAVDDFQAAFSPDGERLAFRSERDGGGLFTMGATGESVRRVTDVGFNPTWSPDGRSLAFATEGVDDPYARSVTSQLWTVEIESGKTRQLTKTTDAVQPAWSPRGDRIAYWANTGGQRDIWTISEDGGEPLAVTQDPFTDWSPAWSPDGRWLYFSSDRNGGMNLWRVAIDPATGRRQGEPQPVTAGTRDIGYATLSADGKRMAVMAYDRTADIARHGMDALLAGDERPEAVLRRQSAGWCAPSPDGAWLSCTTRGAQEDLVLLRADGSEMRRLMDDPDKDRGSVWTPDGDGIVFYSTRGGAWDAWSISIDGSGLRRFTGFSDWGGGVLSPDGARYAVNAAFRGVVVVEVAGFTDLDSMVTLPLPDGYPPGRFWPLAWSSDGKLLAGVEADELTGRTVAYAIYDLDRESLRTLAITPGAAREVALAGWLPDSPKLVLVSDDDLVAYDVTDGKQTRLAHAAPRVAFRLSGDGKVLIAEREVLDSEIWLLTFD